MGHPTGPAAAASRRYPFDFEKIVNAAVRRNVYLEINGIRSVWTYSASMVRTAKGWEEFASQPIRITRAYSGSYALTE